MIHLRNPQSGWHELWTLQKIWTPPFFLTGRGCSAIELPDQVLMLLHFVAHRGKYGLLSDTFGVSRSSYYASVDHMLQIVVDHLLRKFISWPDVERQKETSDYYESRFKFPGVIGAIDGTHISLSRPPGEFFPKDYFSIRKKIYTMLLQVKITKPHCPLFEANTSHCSHTYKDTIPF